jgi:hypothetical protein
MVLDRMKGEFEVSSLSEVKNLLDLLYILLYNSRVKLDICLKSSYC